jgi:23S rRNA pseudouridine2605 synthase
VEERLQKVIAAAGLCSRRAAETLLAEGRVSVNGQTAHVGDRADPEHDTVTVDGKPVGRQEKTVYLMLNKPRGYVTTLSDEQGRSTVAELVEGVGVRVFPVGRLDLQSEGLLLMTNDGALMQRLIHPKYEVSKTYWLNVAGNVRGAAGRLAAVTSLEGEQIRPARVELLRETGNTAELSVTIHEGKNRQIRRMCESCDLIVKRLRRVREHTLELGDLPEGQWRYLTDAEVAALQGADAL